MPRPCINTFLLAALLPVLGCGAAADAPVADKPAQQHSGEMSVPEAGLIALPSLAELSALNGASSSPVRSSSLIEAKDVEFAPDENIAAQSSSTDFDAELSMMLYYPPAEGLAWVVYERQGIAEDFATDNFWVVNNGKPHYTAVANFEKGYWELYPGKNVYYSGGTLKGNRTSLKHSWEWYVNPAGSMFIAVLSQDEDFRSGAIGNTIEFERLRTPSGLHIDTIAGGTASLLWNEYSDPRDLRLVIIYPLASGQLREKVLAEDSTSALIPHFEDSEYCIMARWPEKGVDSAPSAWVTP